MRKVFADTCYWVALLNPKDAWYVQAISISQSLQPLKIVTTEEVLAEVLTFYSGAGEFMRRRTVQLIQDIFSDETIEVVEQTHASFLLGFALYQNRLDKGYSLPDCISMNTMRRLGITEVLTHDRHFAQEGSTILLRMI